MVGGAGFEHVQDNNGYKTKIFRERSQSEYYFYFPIKSYSCSQPVMSKSSQHISYSEKYTDQDNEYRHVILPPDISRILPKGRLLTEKEWRSLGVQQSRGWVHYAIHRPEPHILLFRRKLETRKLETRKLETRKLETRHSESGSRSKTTMQSKKKR